MPLDAEAARRVYDRIGRAQDSQRFYEDQATRRLAEVAALYEAERVFELGCGTGRLAARLLAAELGESTRYLGVDVSPRMVDLARDRLARWAPRAEARLLDPPAISLPGSTGSFDRVLATYVLDLLSSDHARELVAEAHRLLEPDGLLCAVSLTHGETAVSRLVSSVWGAVAAVTPALVGGCRPIEVSELLSRGGWRITHREVISSWGVPSEVVVARREATR
jgi:ubiquinone/menaquinone biosynthesis C-methylase UbiE